MTLPFPGILVKPEVNTAIHPCVRDVGDDRTEVGVAYRDQRTVGAFRIWMRDGNRIPESAVSPLKHSDRRRGRGSVGGWVAWEARCTDQGRECSSDRPFVSIL